MTNENDSVAIGKIQTDIGYIKNTLGRLESKIDKSAQSSEESVEKLRRYVDDNFVEQSEFDPIKDLYDRANAAMWGLLIFIGTVALAAMTFFSEWVKKNILGG